MSDTAIRLAQVGKMYKIFASRRANLLDSLGVGRFLPRAATTHQQFWALRGIDFEMLRGQRIGVIGRNGAGKTTVLKLITGNLEPTEGYVEVHGRVQSLMDAGGGLHPEFTGVENIRAALTYQGLVPREIRAAEAEIAEFTELGDFIDRPFKTYSMGMQARLAFTIATTVNPEILIIDEMLGAGDAYFFGKSISRMQQLVDSGASVIIVSHALDQIIRFCDRAIWLDRGQVVAQGPTLDVVKGYEKFIRRLEDRRLRGKNQKVRSNRFKGLQSEGYVDTVFVRVTVRGLPASWCDVAEVALFKGEELEDSMVVGSPQDANQSQSAHLVMESGWGQPVQSGDSFHRRIEVAPGEGENLQADGTVRILCWAFEDDRPYRVEVRYRSSAGSEIYVEVIRNGELLDSVLVDSSTDWQLAQIGVISSAAPIPLPAVVVEPSVEIEPPPAPPEPAHEEPDLAARIQPEIANLSRWPGEGSLMIEEVQLLNSAGAHKAVFIAHKPMAIVVRIKARRPGTFPLIMASLVFRLDGIVVTRHIGEMTTFELEADEAIEAILDLGPLNLGNGHYVLSVGLYRKLDPDDIEAPEIYDYLDRSYEFQVVGNSRLHNELFRHPGKWRLKPLTHDQGRTQASNE